MTREVLGLGMLAIFFICYNYRIIPMEDTEFAWFNEILRFIMKSLCLPFPDIQPQVRAFRGHISAISVTLKDRTRNWKSLDQLIAYSFSKCKQD